ncbi:hypothetical protein ACN28S_32030 [Cystobacter fuscus]
MTGFKTWNGQRMLALLFLLALCCLMKCASAPADMEMNVEGSAFWPVPVATSKAHLIPMEDGWHSWVVDSDGIHGVDGEGRRTHEVGSWWMPGARVSELLPTGQPRRAWVVAHSTRREGTSTKALLYTVGANGDRLDGRLMLEADRLIPLRNQVVLSPYDVFLDLRPLEDRTPHPYLWMVYSLSGSDVLGMASPGGDVKPVAALEQLAARTGTNVNGWQVVPVGDGSAVWLKTGKHLFFIDARASAPVKGPFLGVNELYWVVPGAAGTQAWVMAEADLQSSRRLYSVTAMAAPATKPSPLLNEAVRQCVRAADGAHLWVAGSTNPDFGGTGGLHLMDSKGTSLLASGPLFPGQDLLIAATRSGRVWVLTRSGGAYLLDESGRVIAGRMDLLPLSDTEEGSFDVLRTYPAGSRDGLLVRTNRVFHLRADGDSVIMSPSAGRRGSQLPQRGSRWDGRLASIQG